MNDYYIFKIDLKLNLLLIVINFIKNIIINILMDIDWFSIKDSAGSQECVNDLDNIVEVKLKSDFSRIKLSESINNIIDNIKKKIN